MFKRWMVAGAALLLASASPTAITSASSGVSPQTCNRHVEPWRCVRTSQLLPIRVESLRAPPVYDLFATIDLSVRRRERVESNQQSVAYETIEACGVPPHIGVYFLQPGLSNGIRRQHYLGGSYDCSFRPEASVRASERCLDASQ